MMIQAQVIVINKNVPEFNYYNPDNYIAVTTVLQVLYQVDPHLQLSALCAYLNGLDWPHC